MKTYLTKLNINGIKNIETTASFAFYKGINSKFFDASEYNVKAIYGLNGLGKSGIVHALKIYRNIIRDDLLNDSSTKRSIIPLINKKNKQLAIELEFILIDENNEIFYIFKHKLVLSLRDNDLFLDTETIEYKKPSSKLFQLLYKTNNGNIVTTKFSPLLTSKLVNLVDKRTLSNILFFNFFTNNVKNIDFHNQDYKFFDLIIYLVYFSESINVYMEDIDHVNSQRLLNTDLSSDLILQVSEQMSLYSNSLINELRPNNSYHNNNKLSDKLEFNVNSSDIIYPNDFDTYQKNIDKLFKFMQLFKPELQAIELDIKKDYNQLRIEKNLVYKDYSINSIFESAGIKKLIKIFNALTKVSEGQIVIFDELDSNINDVFLIKIIEYVSLYTSGQMIITTHNLAPMEVLKRKKKALDFLDPQLGVSEWVKNGNYNVVNLYRDGMLKNLPFNIQSFEFIEIFSE